MPLEQDFQSVERNRVHARFLGQAVATCQAFHRANCFHRRFAPRTDHLHPDRSKSVATMSGAQEGTRQRERFDPPRAAKPVQICGTVSGQTQNLACTQRNPNAISSAGRVFPTLQFLDLGIGLQGWNRRNYRDYTRIAPKNRENPPDANEVRIDDRSVGVGKSRRVAATPRCD